MKFASEVLTFVRFRIGQPVRASQPSGHARRAVQQMAHAAYQVGSPIGSCASGQHRRRSARLRGSDSDAGTAPPNSECSCETGLRRHLRRAVITTAQRGGPSREVGGQLLQVLTDADGPMMLRDLAGSAGMSAAKAHPYLVSFMQLGLIEQDRATGRYELGPLALQMGLASMRRLNRYASRPKRLPSWCCASTRPSPYLCGAIMVRRS
jgi:hypothetical protein